MKIFISYRRAEDNKSYIVGTIHERLAKVFGEKDIFRDTYDIAGGSNWRDVLGREINTCQVMLVIIGPDWANLADSNGEKRLFNEKDVTRWEVQTGLERSQEGKATVIPVLVLGARVPKADELPDVLRPLLEKNVVPLRNFPDFDNDMQKLIRDIRGSQGFAEDDIEVQRFEPKTIYIAEGPFSMGSEPGEGIPQHETPLHEVFLPSYRIGAYPVTNLQYEEFMRQTRTPVPLTMGWEGQRPPKSLKDHPVIRVTWFEARAYCDWLSKVTGRKYSLPNETQWEKACRGGNSFFYPWGDEFDPTRCNHGQPDIAPVDKYPPQNAFGCFDLVGNIWQWTCTLWGEERTIPNPEYSYPWENDRRNDPNASREIYRVIRGSTMEQNIRSHRCTARRSEAPELRGKIGFRVVMSV